MVLFEGFRGAHGTYADEDRNEAKGGKLEIKRTAKTLREPVTEELWRQHLQGARPLGVITIREDDCCVWGCVDVDSYTVNHAELVGRITKLGFPLVVCKSKSGGAHIFIFLTEAASAASVAALLREMAAALGLAGSEIFPKQSKILKERGDLGSWLNMPYYGGDESKRAGVKKTGALMRLGEFVAAAESSRVRIEDVRVRRSRVSSSGASKSGGVVADDEEGDSLDEGPPCLQHLAEQGFPEGTRNTGLLALGVFAKKKFSSRWQTVLETYNRELMVPPLPHTEVGIVIKSLEKKDYHYKCKDEPLCSHCNSTLCRTRKYGVGWSEEFPTLGGLSVLNSDPPLWFVEVEDERLEMSTDDLQNYKRFHKICMEKCRVTYQMLKQETWLKMVAQAMRDVQVIDAPPEVGITGHFGELLEDFCTNRHRGEQKEDVLSGKPWEDQDRKRHYFRLRDLQLHLERAGFKSYTRPQITARLRQAGGADDFFNVDGKGVNVWWIPAMFVRAQAAKVRGDKESPI